MDLDSIFVSRVEEQPSSPLAEFVGMKFLGLAVLRISAVSCPASNSVESGTHCEIISSRNVCKHIFEVKG